jgi:hypothetical protein
MLDINRACVQQNKKLLNNGKIRLGLVSYVLMSYLIMIHMK